MAASILIVEDNIINQKVACRMLQNAGFDVTVASNGSEALARIRETAPDLVLMDLQMPVMDGFEATAALRKRERQTGIRIPIVALTANAMKGDREKCLEIGMDGYVSKPINKQMLMEEIGRLLPVSAVHL
jgi:CheY-like chemotaxis protein